jgi:hypothetical protein
MKIILLLAVLIMLVGCPRPPQPAALHPTGAADRGTERSVYKADPFGYVLLRSYFMERLCKRDVHEKTRV